MKMGVSFDKILITTAFILGASFILPVFSQQKDIQLTKVTTGKKQVLEEGYRVQYTLQANPKVHHVGILESVTDSLIIVQGDSIAFDQLKSLGRRRKGSGFWAFMGGFVGTGIIIGSIQSSNYDPCPSCIDGGSSGEGWTAVEIGLGVAIIGLGINTAVRNSPRDLVSKWKLEIIDSPDQQNIKK